MPDFWTSRYAVPAMLLSVAACGGPLPEDRVRPDTQDEPVTSGTVTITPAALDLVGPPGVRVVGGVRVANDGDFTLRLIAASMSNDARGQLVTDAATNADRALREGESFEVLVVCQLQGADPAAGTLEVETDDAARPRVDVPVTCSPADDTDGG